jgi:hypothetical protein
MYSRQRFDVSTDTGRWADTGPPFSGELSQIAWNPSTPDTGGDLQLVLMPTRSSDTGQGFSVYSNNDCLGADFVHALRRSANAPDGSSDTGHLAPIVGSGRLRVKVTPGGAACVGALYAWIKH